MEYETIQNAKLCRDRILKCSVVRRKGRMDVGINNIYKLFKVSRGIPLQSHTYHSQTSPGAALMFLCSLLVECHTIHGHDHTPLKSDLGMGVTLKPQLSQMSTRLAGSCWPLRTHPEHYVLREVVGLTTLLDIMPWEVLSIHRST